MKLLLMASNLSPTNSGVGGHYSSIRDLRKAFTEAWPNSNIEILSIGNVQPVAFRGQGSGVHHFDTSGKSFRSIRDGVRSIVSEVRPTHIHAFDNKSFAHARHVARLLGARAYLTRPGGPNPAVYFPIANDIVCFSRENYDFLKGKRKLRGSRVHLVPQRVMPPSWDSNRSAELQDMASGKPILLRVARLAALNRTSILQSIELSRVLQRQKVDHVLAIIGTPNDPELVSLIRAELRDSDLLLTDEHFTSDAEQLTPAARGVVGSGRTLVEAALADVVLYAPLAERLLPTVVTMNNRAALAERNFSARSSIRDDLVSSEKELAEAFRAGTSSVSRAIAQEMKIDATVVDRYAEIYDAVQCGPDDWWDALSNWASFALRHWRTEMEAKRKMGILSRLINVH